MNGEFSTDPRRALESSLTASLLGELSPDQERFVQQAIANDPELAKNYEELKATIALLKDAHSTTPEEPGTENSAPRLSEPRRRELLQRFKTVRPTAFQEPKRRRAAWLVPLATAAALVMLLATLLLPAVSRTKSRSLAERTRVEMRRSAGNAELSGGTKLDNDAIASLTSKPWSQSAVTKPFGDDLASVQNEKRRELVRNNIVLPTQTDQEQAGRAKAPAETDNLALSFQPDSLPLGVTSGGNVAFGLNGGAEVAKNALIDKSDAKPAEVPQLGDTPIVGALLAQAPEQERQQAHYSTFNAVKKQEQNSPQQRELAEHLDYDVASKGVNRPEASVPLQQPGIVAMSETQAPSAAQAVARPVLGQELKDSTSAGIAGSEKEALLKQEPVQKALRERLYEKAKEETLGRKSVSLDKIEAEKPVERTIQDQRDEGSKTPAPIAPLQPEIQTRDNPFSTFSLHVSDVSFKLAAASLENGAMPDPGSIRSEEFINAFDYRDPDPAPDMPVAFACDRAQYPFAQNRDLLRFSIKTASVGRQSGRALNVVVLLDNSGSMERADRVRITHAALQALAAQLHPQDVLSVVTFARTAHLWVDGVPGDQAGRIADELNGLTPQGGTNLEEAMNLAYQTALRHFMPNGINRVVLLTDGAANLGETSSRPLRQKVETNRKQGIALDCFGVGWDGYNDTLLEELSRHGDGRYGFLNTPEETATNFASQLAGALRVAAADVKVQVEFNPARVTSYRQIGYSHHQLTKEQFRDNQVDAAELGDAESGNGLYVVEVNPQGKGPLATVRVRYKTPGTDEYHEHEWSVPFVGAAPLLEQASPSLRLAACAGAFSEWLAGNSFAAEVTPDRLLGCMGGVTGAYGSDPRPQKLEWMIRQAKAISGK